MTRRRRSSEKGAALLSTLMVVAAMSVAAIAALDALARNVSVSKTGQARMEAVWAARSAEAAGQSLLAGMLALTGGAVTEQTPGLGETQVFLTPRGTLTATLTEANNCFNLNALTAGEPGAPTRINADMLERYRTLLIAADFDPGEAGVLADTLADWMDADTLSRSTGAEDRYYESLDPPYRASGQRLESMAELNAIAGYTPDIRARLAPLLCVRPGSRQSVLNLNTLTLEQAPLLVSLFSKEVSVDLAERFLDIRPETGWRSLADFVELEELELINEQALNYQAVSIVSSYFALSADLVSDDTRAHLDVIYLADPEGAVQTIWRREGGSR